MKNDCPKCGLDLTGRWVPSKRLPEGAPFWQAWDSTLVCPACRAPIRQNDNPRDVTFIMLQVLAFAATFFALEFTRWSAWFWASLAIFVGVTLWRSRYQKRHLEDWSNWAPNEEAKGEKA